MPLDSGFARKAAPAAQVVGALSSAAALPDYLTKTYSWAYLNRTALFLLDRPSVVSSILWGNYRRLLRATLDELSPGERVLQPACVYGDFSVRLAQHLGPDGHLEVADVAPLQIENCRRKLRELSQATTVVRDAAAPLPRRFDAVCCFFLLHELPDPHKRQVVTALLRAVRPGGKIVFVDYHRPHPAHPLKGVMRLVFDGLEPFAKALWTREIASYGEASADHVWSKQTFFGGLYQKTVARRADRQLFDLAATNSRTRIDLD